MHLLNPHLQRAELLINQGRFDLAEEHVRRAIGEQPDHALPYSYLALCLSHAEQHTEATDAARRAVGLAPDDAYGHRVLASVLHRRDDEAAAMVAIDEALRLDPDDPHAWALKGSIHLARRQWREALAAAEQGLAFDGEHENCINIRAAALARLGRTQEAGEAIDSTLARNPENAHSHANMGWTLLHRREPRKAMEHFREALRLDPTMDHARSGIVEAMKARNFIYRWFLAYLLFMNRLSSQAQWGILIGGYIAYQIARRVSQSGHPLAPVATVLAGLYLVFALGTLLAYPLFNLLLSISRFGRLALRRDQFIAAVALGLALVPPLAAGVHTLITGSPQSESLAWIFGALVIPVAMSGQARPGRDRMITLAVTAALALLGLAHAANVLAGYGFNPVMKPLIVPYMIGCVATIWLGNILGSLRAPVKR